MTTPSPTTRCDLHLHSSASLTTGQWFSQYFQAPESYADRSLAGCGTPTASQTAWAVAGLVAAGRHDSREARRGVQWLATHQSADGSWDESEFTGTGFPKVFYLRYHYYPIYFPLMALARFSQAAACSRDVRERVA